MATKQNYTTCKNLYDIYNRPKQLQSWIQRIDTELEDEQDQQDILKFVEFLQDKESATLWIVRCIYSLITIRKQIGKPFKDATKDDIRSFLKWMENEKNYKVSTNETFRKILKYFYKVVYGKNEFYPDIVKWFSRRVGKEQRRKEKEIDIEDYLDEDDIQKLVASANTVQRKALLGCMYESGARPEEFLKLTNNDVRLDIHGAVLILRGKTGERAVRIISFVPLLNQWLNIHPLKEQIQFPIWISEATNYKNKYLELGGAQKIMKVSLERAGLENKHGRLYDLRHARATHLAKYLTEAQMWTFFGWVPGTNVIRRYVHLSGRDIDSTLLAISEGKQVVLEQYKLKSTQCIRCHEKMYPDSNFCDKCGLSIDLNREYLEEKDTEAKYHKLQLDFDNLRKETDNKLSKILEIMAVHPELGCIKSEILLNKILT
jgi:integrase